MYKLKFFLCMLIAIATIDPVGQHSHSGLANTYVHQAATQISSEDIVQNVTSVSQLSDVQPTDWAFTALQRLIESYGCIGGYPDRTFRGQRALTRFEFAAGLNACLDKVNQLLAADLADKVANEDLASLQKLQGEFTAELATIRGRVDVLEAKTTQLQEQQFSTTTKLTGESVLALRFTSYGSNTAPIPSGLIPGTTGSFPAKNTSLGYRMRLNFNTSFIGRDNLLIRLQAANFPRFGGGFNTAAFTNMGALQPDANDGSATNGNVSLDLASYSFAIAQDVNIKIIAIGGKLDDFAPTLNPLDFGGSALGAISEFGQRNAIYRLSRTGTGAGLDYALNDNYRLSFGYLGGTRNTTNTITGNISGAASDSTNGGLFGGTYGVIAQFTLTPTRNIDLGFTYVRSFLTAGDVPTDIGIGVTGGLGSHLSSTPLGTAPMTVNSYGFQSAFRISPNFILGGWFGLSDVTSEGIGLSGAGNPISAKGSKATIINWAVTLAFPDLFKNGSLGGIIIGQEPKITSSDATLDPLFTGGVAGLPQRDFNAESYHFEMFYRYQLTKNLSITPGVVLITNPEYNASNPAIFTGTVRMTFTF
jgi:hypothetical protein